MIRFKVHFYAQLKDFFGDAIELELAVGSTVADLFAALSKKNALAAEWLRVSRAAGEDAFLSHEQLLTDAGSYYILPPWSGG